MNGASARVGELCGGGHVVQDTQAVWCDEDDEGRAQRKDEVQVRGTGAEGREEAAGGLDDGDGVCRGGSQYPVADKGEVDAPAGGAGGQVGETGESNR